MSRPGGRAILTGLYSVWQWRKVERRAARRSFTYPYMPVLERILAAVERLAPWPEPEGGFEPGPLIGEAPASGGCLWGCPCQVDYGDGETA